MTAPPTPKLAWDDVEVGAEAPAVVHQLGRTDLVKYAGASGDYNPMHTDEVAAQAAGLPSVFGHGMFSMGLLGRALTDWAGAGNLTNYKVRFTKQTWPGETLTTTVVVTAKRVSSTSTPPWPTRTARSRWPARPPSSPADQPSSRSARTASAALRPLRLHTPPAGWVAAPHR